MLCFMQLLVFKLAKLIPAVQGQMDSAAGLRLKVCHLQPTYIV